MEVSSTHQVNIFLIYVLAGIGCGAFFDVQRFLRKKIKAGYARTCIEDIIFASVCVGVMIILGYHYNNGELRYYQVMGSVSGALFYGAFLSRAFTKILNVTFIVLRNVMWVPVVKIIETLLIPIRKFMYRIKRLYLRIKKIFGRLRRDIKKRKIMLKKKN